ncbi:MAG: ORF6N domain-containing protein [Gammaproteobacteria bacterium]
MRGQRILLDSDLAPPYGVSTRVLTQAVRRNPERFPGDFMFQLVADEIAILRSQAVISSFGHGRSEPGSRFLFFVTQ